MEAITAAYSAKAPASKKLTQATAVHTGKVTIACFKVKWGYNEQLDWTVFLIKYLIWGKQSVGSLLEIKTPPCRC